ncbi:hypothetical protein KBY52_25420, partial [Salmonella enterica subsp. enterica serovar Typhimurium]
AAGRSAAPPARTRWTARRARPRDDTAPRPALDIDDGVAQVRETATPAADSGELVRGCVATGVGSWPGTDPREAAATVLGELPDLAHLVELPERGVGADMIGRVSALLVELRFDTSTRGYRLTPRPGAVSRRARDLLRADLDALEEAWETSGSAGT